jgi:hypothetical protein
MGIGILDLFNSTKVNNHTAIITEIGKNKSMEPIIIKDKQKYLNENYPFEDIPKLTDQKHCIHCDNNITVGDYKVFTDGDGEEYICCPNAPDCDGTVIDWLDVDQS